VQIDESKKRVVLECVQLELWRDSPVSRLPWAVVADPGRTANPSGPFVLPCGMA
jgi:hypothetical protein